MQSPIGDLRRSASRRVKQQIVGCVFGSMLFVSGALLADPRLPITSGHYRFEFKDAEFANIAGIAIRVTINGLHLRAVSDDASSTLWPKGTVVEEGLLLWHPGSGQWIIGQKRSDRHATEVGGCSDGPDTIDFKQRIVWHC